MMSLGKNDNKAGGVSVLLSIVVYRTPAAEIGSLIGHINLELLSLRWSVVVTDNFGDSGLADVCRAAGWTYVYSGKNVGFGRGHNEAVKRFSKNFDYLLLLNPDLYITHNAIGAILRYMTANPRVSLVSPRLLNADQSIQPICRKFPTPASVFGRVGSRLLSLRDSGHVDSERSAVAPLRVPAMHGACFFLRKRDFVKVGGFSQEFFLYVEDFDLCRKIWDVGEVVFYPHAEAIHIHGRASYKRLKLAFVHFISYCRYFIKWGIFFDKDRAKLNRYGSSALD